MNKSIYIYVYQQKTFRRMWHPLGKLNKSTCSTAGNDDDSTRRPAAVSGTWRNGPSFFLDIWIRM